MSRAVIRVVLGCSLLIEEVLVSVRVVLLLLFICTFPCPFWFCVLLISPLNRFLLLEAEWVLLEPTAPHCVCARKVAIRFIFVVGTFEVEVNFRLFDLLLFCWPLLGDSQPLIDLIWVMTLLEDVNNSFILEIFAIILVDSSFLLFVWLLTWPKAGSLLTDLKVRDLVHLNLVFLSLDIALSVSPTSDGSWILLLLHLLLRLVIPVSECHVRLLLHILRVNCLPGSCGFGMTGLNSLWVH